MRSGSDGISASGSCGAPAWDPWAGLQSPQCNPDPMAQVPWRGSKAIQKLAVLRQLDLKSDAGS